MGLASETVIDLRKDRVKVASGSEKQVEVFNEKQLERLLFYVQGEEELTIHTTVLVKSAPLQMLPKKYNRSCI